MLLLVNMYYNVEKDEKKHRGKGKRKMFQPRLQMLVIMYNACYDIKMLFIFLIVYFFTKLCQLISYF